MPDLRETTIRGVAWSLYGRVGTQVLQYGVSILMARLLSPSDFGRVGMVTVLTLFASVFVDFGIVMWALVRRREGTFRTVSFEYPDTTPYRAWATIVARHEFPGGRRFHFVAPGGCELAVWTDA